MEMLHDVMVTAGHVLKEHANSLAAPLTSICNCSLREFFQLCGSQVT